MKHRVKHFVSNEFQMGKPDVVFSETHLVLKIGEGEIYSGSFIIKSANENDIYGAIYTNSIRLQCLQDNIEGGSVKICFQYNGMGLQPGFVEKGHIYIVCNGGEFEIPFSAIIRKPFIATSQGNIQDLKGFKKVAFHDFEEAKKIFHSKDFYELIKYEPSKIKHLYSNMRKWSLEAKDLEEFLVSIKQKEKIYISFSESEKNYSNVDKTFVDKIKVIKNTWGYMTWNIRANGDFLLLGQNQLCTDEFADTEYELAYQIDDEELHFGNNYGQIIIENHFDTIIFDITIKNRKIERQDDRSAEFLMARLIKSYVKADANHDFNSKWVQGSIQVLTELESNDTQNRIYKLMRAHVYLLDEQKEEAKWILDDYNYNKFGIGRDVEIDAYYLYLTALHRENSSYTKKVVDELQKLYIKYSGSWKILCMLVQIDPYYTDAFERKHALEHQYYLGVHSMILYLEGYKCFSARCSNLKKIGEFEIQILNFATKQKIISKELALYAANLAMQHKEFNPKILKVLEEAYMIHNDIALLTTICTILIKGNITDNRYFKWYELAIKEELKIAKIFEYYMSSINEEFYSEELPRTIFLYFAHGSNLPKNKLAFLYANLVTYEKESSELFAYYRERITVFTMQQLEQRRINKHLRILYRYCLNENEMNIEKIRAIYNITFSYLVKTTAKNIKSVGVIDEDGLMRQKVSYKEKGAIVVLDSKDDILVWETKSGEHLVGNVDFQSERMFYEIPFVEICNKHLDIYGKKEAERELIELNYENLGNIGPHIFDETEVLEFCNEVIIENEFIEDGLLEYLCLYLFKREVYDRNILVYLSMYYSGDTKTQRDIWNAAVDYEIDVIRLSSNILSNAVYTGNILGCEEIFFYYYENEANLRVVSEYLSIYAREYFVMNKQINPKIIQIIKNELIQKVELANIVKIALLHYHSRQEYDASDVELLKRCMQELCEKQIYFSFYFRYSETWLREVQLWDKTLVSYVSKWGGKVRIFYRLLEEGIEEPAYESEVLMSMYENIYVKKLLIFQDETLQYYFQEEKNGEVVNSKTYQYKANTEQTYYGKYGRLNELLQSEKLDEGKFKAYALENVQAKKVFVPYD